MCLRQFGYEFIAQNLNMAGHALLSFYSVKQEGVDDV